MEKNWVFAASRPWKTFWNGLLNFPRFSKTWLSTTPFRQKVIKEKSLHFLRKKIRFLDRFSGCCSLWALCWFLPFKKWKKTAHLRSQKAKTTSSPLDLTLMIWQIIFRSSALLSYSFSVKKRLVKREVMVSLTVDLNVLFFKADP